LSRRIIAYLPPGRGVNQIHMPPHELGERVLVARREKSLQKCRILVHRLLRPLRLFYFKDTGRQRT
jgi:hypothetical protein